MNKYTFELELIQLEELFSKSRSNKFSDPDKTQFFNKLHEVFEAIVKKDYNDFGESKRVVHQSIFAYLFNGLEYLDTSTLNIIPFELITCLEKALSDWVDSDDLIIVTSLSNRRSEIWFEGLDKEGVTQIKSLIYSEYSIQIPHRLIRVSLPKSLSRDYLSGVVLYHELGHFVDQELNISDKIFYERYGKTSNEIDHEEEYNFYFYTKEYFADLFAAQYVNDASANYLGHLAYNEGDSLQHPATSKRNKIVRTFLEGKSSEEIDLIQKALNKTVGRQFEIRHQIISPEESEFKELIPEELNNNRELHGIFKLGWDLWLKSDINFLKNFSRRQKYYIVNNLVEKSISNYNVLNNWKEVNKTKCDE